MHWKMLYAKYTPFCPGVNVLHIELQSHFPGTNELIFQLKITTMSNSLWPSDAVYSNIELGQH